jgi:hypothetical protein
MLACLVHANPLGLHVVQNIRSQQVIRVDGQHLQDSMTSGSIQLQASLLHLCQQVMHPPCRTRICRNIRQYQGIVMFHAWLLPSLPDQKLHKLPRLEVFSLSCGDSQPVVQRIGRHGRQVDFRLLKRLLRILVLLLRILPHGNAFPVRLRRFAVRRIVDGIEVSAPPSVWCSCRGLQVALQQSTPVGWEVR